MFLFAYEYECLTLEQNGVNVLLFCSHFLLAKDIYSTFICMSLCVWFCFFFVCAILLINNNQIVLNFISINCGNAPGYYWPRRNFHYISRADAAPAGALRRTDAAGLHLV